MQRLEVGAPGSVVGRSNVVFLFEVVVTPLCLDVMIGMSRASEGVSIISRSS